MRRLLPLALALVALLPPAAVHHAADEPLARWVEQALATSRAGEPPFSGIVAVARRGRFVHVTLRGSASRDRPLDLDTRFRVGSLTKQVSAVAVMQLVEQGALRLEAPLGQYLPELPPRLRTPTLHQLLTHGSGLFSYTDDPRVMRDRARPHPRSEVLASIAARPLGFTPGTAFSYSNSNYYLLGLAIERASGLSFEAYLRRHVLGPAGMARTSSLDMPSAANTATGHRLEGGRLVPVGDLDMSLPFAAGALRSTARDLLSWDRALAGGVLLSPASLTRLTTPAHGGYAYGVGIERRHGHAVALHGGGIDGFSAFLARVPAHDLAVIVLANVESFDASRVGRALVERLCRAPASAARALR